MYNLLFVDDDKALLDANQQYFSQRDYLIHTAQTAARALEILSSVRVDCVILDVDLPDGNGFEICQRMREVTSLPVIFLSAYTEAESLLRGFTVGGDDYMTKPYSQQELELRIRARIRGRYDEPAPVLTFGLLCVDAGQRTVHYGQTQGDFSRIEFDLLLFLAKHPNQIFSYEQLYDRVWKEPLGESRHNLQARMAAVRQKLADLCPEQTYIETIRRKGYRFTP